MMRPKKAASVSFGHCGNSKCKLMHIELFDAKGDVFSYATVPTAKLPELIATLLSHADAPKHAVFTDEDLA